MQLQRATQRQTAEASHQKNAGTSIQPPLSTFAPAHPIPQLQRAIGNQAVQRLIRSRTLQAKLAVIQPSDIYEQEADRVAEQVIRMPAPTLQRACAPCAAGGPPCPKCENEKTGLARRKTEQSSDIAGVSDDFLQNLGPGHSLDASTRAFFEPRFGHDFSQVRVHTDAKAAESARSVDALAYTMGRDVVFGAERYTPGTNGGRRLLAHELTHVVQQSGNSILPQLQREEAPVKATSGACSVVDVFSELNPGIVLPSAYFRNREPVEKDKYKSEMEISKKGNCVTKANFSDVTLRWDLGNPKLGSWYTLKWVST